MTGNIVGEPFDKFVRDQINLRQSNQFSGYNSLRTDNQLKYLSNRNAWIKLASSVNVIPDAFTPSSPEEFVAQRYGLEFTGTTIPLGESKLRNIGFSESEAKNYLGTKLAEKAVLFNTISQYTPSGKLSNNRAGITNIKDLWNDDFIYGIGGTNYGIQPPPGIIGATVDSLNRGSIRKANITLKAHNKFQFDIIELLYLRLGFTMMLEWGWDKYLDNETGTIQQVGNTIIEEEWFISNGISQREMLSKIQQKRTNYFGNYDGFFGKVSNFTWSFNPDGSYDISIDLITIGDVIESLKVNTSVKEKFSPDGGIFEEIKFNEDDSLFNTNIAKASSLNTIGYFLYKKIKEISSLTNQNRNDYIQFDIDGTATSKSSQYYIRLGEFFSQLESLVIPKIQNNGVNSTSQIMFEKFGCLISYFPNQIPLDPRVCLFKPSLNTYGDITGITDPSYFNVIPISYLANINDRTYGLLTNLYINFEFIAGLLTSNGGPDQELYLFKFLQDLCNGINNALGGVNKLEPVIKDDYFITIIDQTLSIPEEENVVLEIYGYNKDAQTSNFVKDVKFVSKITPQLASMVTIGATAAGGSTSEIDGTAFTKFSEGLEDRFSKEIFEPDGLSKLKRKEEEEQAKKSEEDYKTKFLSFKRAYEGNIIQQTGEFLTEIATSTISGLANLRLEINKLFGTENSTDNFFGTSAVDASNRFEILDNDLNEERIIIDLRAGFEEINGVPMSFSEYKNRMPELERKAREDKKYDENELNQLVSENYSVYLTNAFGGVQGDVKVTYQNSIKRLSGTGATVIGKDFLNSTTTKNLEVKSEESRYLKFDDIFITQGKSAYKVYINNLNNVIYKTSGSPSSEIGFIPLSFELVLDGISGIKIYQKLNINNKFLPSNYPESLKFIITKVNHNISNNSWDTSLSTISIPRTEPYKYETIPSQTNTNARNTVSGPIGPQPDNGSSFLILDGRNNRDIITLDSLLLELDPVARPAFRKFFEILKEKYSGYKAIVNDVRRTWEESYNLKKANSKNAEPGRSQHNYGLAIDINIETPASTTKRTLLKNNKTPWIEEGIDKVAIDAGLRWGGNFIGYIDCVHFDFDYNIDTAYRQVTTQAKNLDSTIIPPFTGFTNEVLAKVKKIDKLIKEGKIKLQ
jgi:hypothetical protein